ncbi:MAG TPA: methyltransferase [Candidatus Xenobia bacterium]|nr:methyltransferase [Candidatus Xenobia bacterium]
MADVAALATRLRVPLHFLLAAALVWLARPTPRLWTLGAAVVALGLLVRGWAAGHLRRESPLTVSGPYARLRHPLYFGSALLLAGFALASGEPLFGVVAMAYFLVVFVPVMRREEQERRAGAAELYAAYAAQVPALWPRLWPAQLEGAGGRFNWQQYGRNREWRAAVGCVTLLALLYAKMMVGW